MISRSATLGNNQVENLNRLMFVFMQKSKCVNLKPSEEHLDMSEFCNARNSPKAATTGQMPHNYFNK